MRRGELVSGDIIWSLLQRSTPICVKESGQFTNGDYPSLEQALVIVMGRGFSDICDLGTDNNLGEHTGPRHEEIPDGSDPNDRNQFRRSSRSGGGGRNDI